MTDEYWSIKNYSDLPAKLMELWVTLGIEIWSTIFDSLEMSAGQASPGPYNLQHFYICTDDIFDIIQRQNFMFVLSGKNPYL